MFTGVWVRQLSYIKCCGFLLYVLLLAVCPAQGQTFQQQPKRDTSFEEMPPRINPHETDSIWEEAKNALIDQMRRPYFRYNLAATVTIVWLLIVLFIQRIIHRRAEDAAVDSLADALRQDAHSREEARQAIRRYNDHIEACNRVIEERERLAAASSDEAESDSAKNKADRVAQELTATPTNKRDNRQELELPSQAIAASAQLSKRETPQSAHAGAPPAPIQRYLDLISELQRLIAEERRKNREIERNHRRHDHARNTHESGS